MFNFDSLDVIRSVIFVKLILIEFVGRRIQSGDIRDIDDLYERHIYLCGSVSFMDTISSSLEECHVKSEKVHKESFAF